MNKITIENCGGFFDDFVLVKGNGKLIAIKARAKELPIDELINCKRSPEHANAILEIYSDIDKSYCDPILKSGSISKKQYNHIVEQLKLKIS